jgi:hypothetical protein
MALRHLDTTHFDEHPEIRQKLTELRQALFTNGFAFGAMFIGVRGKAQSMIVLADNMPSHVQRDMLHDCIEGMEELLKHWRIN